MKPRVTGLLRGKVSTTTGCSGVAGILTGCTVTKAVLVLICYLGLSTHVYVIGFNYVTTYNVLNLCKIKLY